MLNPDINQKYTNLDKSGLKQLRPGVIRMCYLAAIPVSNDELAVVASMSHPEIERVLGDGILSRSILLEGRPLRDLKLPTMMDAFELMLYRELLGSIACPEWGLINMCREITDSLFIELEYCDQIFDLSKFNWFRLILDVLPETSYLEEWRSLSGLCHCEIAMEIAAAAISVSKRCWEFLNGELR